VREVSEQTGLPVIFTVVQQELESQLKDMQLAAEIFPVELMMRPSYL
jgi:hypothetical protein